MIRNTEDGWGSVARWFHWGLALAIFGMIAFGWWMNHIPARADKFFYRSIHADIGYVILLLTVLLVPAGFVHGIGRFLSSIGRRDKVGAGENAPP